jgi:hypothetical protein
VVVRPKSKGNEALLQHELTHVEQFWQNPFNGLFYMMSRSHRQAAEVEAYRAQLTYSPCKEDYQHYLDAFARSLSTNYNLDITYVEAVRLLG